MHEEMEVGMNKMVKLLATEAKTQKQKVIQQHKVLSQVKKIQKSASLLKNSYEDKDEGKKHEISAMSGSEVFGGFYSRLRELREYHRKFPNLYYEPDTNDDITLEDDPEILDKFSGEEMHGRFLDLNENHIQFINLKNAKAVSYEVYLNIFLDFASVPLNVKGIKYKNYLKSLKSYLVNFLERAQPLVDFATPLKNAEMEALEKFAKNHDGDEDELDRHVDLRPFQNWEQVSELGMDALKHELMRLGCKCGGSLKERAQRLLSTKGCSKRSELDTKILANAPTSEKIKNKNITRQAVDSIAKEIAVLEAQLAELGELLYDTIEQTKTQVQKKQSRTQEELAAEMENEMGDEEPESEESEEEGEKPIYNPKKVPLDWTGKPIPYWLYKLHGLNIEYKCEICGNYSYWGPRAFERHFQEWRHAHGMRCLKIPNTRAFHNITKIQDALDLFERLKKDARLKEFDAQNQEEFEDANGNVLSKKTYQDLLRQGLL